MKSTAILLILIISKLSFCQGILTEGIYFVDISPSKSDLSELSKYADLSENNSNNYILYNSHGWGITEIELQPIVEDKSRKSFPLDKKVRLYIGLTDSFDNLNILGFSMIYNESVSDSGTEIYFIHPIESFEKNLEQIKYQNLITLIFRYLNLHLTQDKSLNCENTVYDLKVNYNILDPSFYLFTCPETYLYRLPFDQESRISPRGVQQFISNKDSINLEYLNFPSPLDVRFAFKTELHEVKISSNVQVPDYLRGSSNVKLVIKQEYIGLSFRVENTTKVFWAEKNYIDSYLYMNRNYFLAMELFYKLSIEQLFIPLN